MKLSQNQITELEKALSEMTISGCSICVDEVLGVVTKILEKKRFGQIDIENIPLGVFNIEDTDVFKTLLKLFIRQKKKEDPNYSHKEKDIFSNVEMFRGFEEFCSFQSIFKKLTINSENAILDRSRFDAMIDDFKIRFSYHVRMSTKYYDEIIEKLGLNKHDIKTRKLMLKFNTAYNMMKQVFSGIEREGKNEYGDSERSFEHLKGTMEIILRELPNPNINKIIIALLHDVVEDIPGVTYEMLKKLFSPEIADGVMELTKKDWREFLSIEEQKELKIIEQGKNEEKLRIEKNTNKRYSELINLGKDRRNEIYFGNLENLEEDILYVKFADRINNLRTLKGLSAEKIVRKIMETKKYFLDVAINEKERTNGKCKAYDLMVAEIDKLLKDDDIKGLYDLEMSKVTQ
ncbi:MAG: hypothetical protein WC850_06280 [Candidatus Gracilibacteria bacterium]